MKFIFLSYINRSGSTFLVNQLSKLEGICVCPESDALFDLVLGKPNKRCERILSASAMHYLFSEEKFLHWKISQEELKSLIENTDTRFKAFLKVLELYKYKNKPNATVVVFKHNNLLSKTILQNSIGKAFFHLALVRSPYGIYESQKRTISPYTQKVMSKNPVELAYKWNKYVAQVINSKRLANFKLVQYGEVMNDTNKVVGTIATAVGLNPSFLDDGGDLSQFLPDSYKPIHDKAFLSPSTSSVGAWKQGLTDIEKISISIICKKNLSYLKMDKFEVLSRIKVFSFFLMVLKYQANRGVYLFRRIKRRVIW